MSVTGSVLICGFFLYLGNFMYFAATSKYMVLGSRFIVGELIIFSYMWPPYSLPPNMHAHTYKHTHMHITHMHTTQIRITHMHTHTTHLTMHTTHMHTTHMHITHMHTTPMHTHAHTPSHCWWKLLTNWLQFLDVQCFEILLLACVTFIRLLCKSWDVIGS